MNAHLIFLQPRNRIDTAARSAAVALLLLASTLAPFTAQALTIKNLKGQQLQDLYGTYAPRGDCQRGPRITVDDSGFAYTVAGKTTHSGSIELAVGFMGQDYQGISQWFFPFPVSDSDFGRVLMTFNPDERPGTLKFEPNIAKGESLTALQAALVKGSPYAKCARPVASSGAASPAAGHGVAA